MSTHTLTINSRSRLLDLEASKRPSGGDGSIGEVCPGCASATMPAWSQPRRRVPRAVATEWYGDALEHIRQRRRYTSLCCGILCRCADNSSCGEALGRARDGRTRLPLSLQAPSLPIAASLKPAAKRRRTAVFTSLEGYIEIKYTWTIRRHPPYSSVTFSISKFQSSLGLRCFANS